MESLKKLKKALTHKYLLMCMTWEEELLFTQVSTKFLGHIPDFKWESRVYLAD